MRRSPFDWSEGPLFFTGSFDGSQRFSMWLDTLRFARQLRREHGKRVSYTYFINACYYDKSVRGSQIGRAYSDDEVLVRLALTQQAINEGHEIGNHGVRHEDGGSWEHARWKKEFDEFHRIMDGRLFRPVTTDDGGWVFPRFEPLAKAKPGALGAPCKRDADCDSKQCLELNEQTRLCTQPCNARKPCPAGTACGSPNFQQDTDVCVVLPRMPIRHEDKLLFDERGLPNREHPALRPYKIRGFRAPFLSFTEGMIETLLERRYAYDASQVTLPGQPLMMKIPEVKGIVVGFPLMQQPGARTIPMDYNYLKVDVTGALMLRDYKLSLRAAYRHARRPPWSIGHHFSQWHDGAYWRAMQKTMRYAARGCPEEDGPACPQVRMASFRSVHRAMRRLAKRRRSERAAEQ